MGLQKVTHDLVTEKQQIMGEELGTGLACLPASENWRIRKPLAVQLILIYLDLLLPLPSLHLPTLYLCCLHTYMHIPEEEEIRCQQFFVVNIIDVGSESQIKYFF